VQGAVSGFIANPMKLTACAARSTGLCFEFVGGFYYFWRFFFGF
jgi:hypothetical protein